MAKSVKILAIVVVLLGSFSCKRLASFADGEVIATVGDKKLTISETKNIFTADMTPQDSIKLLESYVDMWVKKQLKVMEAEKMFKDSSSDIDEMVENYRNSLLTHKLDQYFVDKYLDTVFTEQQVADYYNEHRSDFVLDRAVVRGVIVKLPDNYRQKGRFKELMSGTGERYQDFRDMALKNGFTLNEFTSWTDFSEFLSYLPTNKSNDYSSMLSERKVIEMKEGRDLYYILVTDSRKTGDNVPLEKVSDMIKRILYNQRKQELVRYAEDSLYNAAQQSRRMDINIY